MSMLDNVADLEKEASDTLQEKPGRSRDAFYDG